MVTQKELNEMVLRHEKGGNGWVMVYDFGDDYCKVAMLGKAEIGQSAYLAWKKMLSPDLTTDPNDKSHKPPLIPKRIPEEVGMELANLRAGLIEGSLKIERARIVKA